MSSLRLIPDADQALADLRELRELAALQRFDLFIFLRELNELGATVMRADIDGLPAEGAEDFVVRYLRWATMSQNSSVTEIPQPVS